MSFLADGIFKADINPDDFGPNGSFDPGTKADEILNFLTWCVSAASVAGLMIVGIQMAVQLRRGEMGEGATYFRGAFITIGACILGTTAGPLVNFVLVPNL